MVARPLLAAHVPVDAGVHQPRGQGRRQQDVIQAAMPVTPMTGCTKVSSGGSAVARAVSSVRPSPVV